MESTCPRRSAVTNGSATTASPSRSLAGMTTYRLAVVGGGNMGAALVGGLLHAGWAAADLAVVEVLPARAAQLEEMFPGVAITGEIPACEAALIAVKPYDVAAACAAAAAAGATRLLSIAAGIGLAALQEAAGPEVAIVRSMPNTPALVGKGAAAICGGPTADDADLAWAESILGSVGIVVRVPEAQLDAVTGLAGDRTSLGFVSETERQVIEHRALAEFLHQSINLDHDHYTSLSRPRTEKLRASCGQTSTHMPQRVQSGPTLRCSAGARPLKMWSSTCGTRHTLRHSPS